MSQARRPHVAPPVEPGSPVGRYLRLGLALGRHLDGLVDAYYGPPHLAAEAADGSPRPLSSLVAEARALLDDLDGSAPLDLAPDGGRRADGLAGTHAGAVDAGPVAATDDIARRRWLRAQVVGLSVTARRLAGERIAYADEVEWCYGVRPRRVPEDDLAAAHRRLDEVLPGSGPLGERLVAWRESHAVPPELLRPAISSLMEDLRERTRRSFGLPDGEQVDFELVTGTPWAGFNYYLGDLHSRVAVNVDVPVLSTSVAHLVAHETYPGHHTEHTRKEIGLVQDRHRAEETIFLVGTPQCLVAEGLADLGLEVVAGRRPEPVVAEHLHPLGIRYDTDVVAAVAAASEALGAVRQNAAFRLHEDGADPEVVVAEVAHWGLLPRDRAEKAVAFLTHPTWRAYLTCYVEGYRLCRRFVAGDPARFDRLLAEQLTPAQLDAEATEEPARPARA
ncbi:MAG: DUF885 domain-containing protein [Actinomycetota bacterium]|nr:DUF885 domain-containing protein [Actinomycetota bacterium]